MSTLTFNQKNLADFSAFWDGSKLFDSPEKEVDFFSVAGRTGDLSISKNRYKNKNRQIPCFIRTDFKANFSALTNYLLAQDGYGILETSEEPDVFIEAEFVDAVEPVTGSFNKSGKFTLVFNCKPQKWLKSGLNGYTVSNGDTLELENPTLHSSDPLVEVYGTGSFTINGITVQVNANNSVVTVDSAIQDAYESTISRNNDIEITPGSDFPKLTKGANEISASGCDIVIYPRWYRL